MKDENSAAVYASAVTLLGDIGLAILKLCAAIASGSVAMLSDAAHSVADVFSGMVVLMGVKLARREADVCHPCGHEKMESLASLFLCVILALTGFGIGAEGVHSIRTGLTCRADVPGGAALYGALLAIAVKEGMYWYTRLAAQRVGSELLRAGAWHHRSDALSSVASFAAVLGARAGFPLLDPVMSLCISLLIWRVAWQIGRKAVASLVDRACDAAIEEKMRGLIRRQAGVLSLNSLRTRLLGSRICVDAVIGVSVSQSLTSAWTTAQRVRHALKVEFPQIKNCTVHVAPYCREAEQDGR